jgi:hypothetical protein
LLTLNTFLCDEELQIITLIQECFNDFLTVIYIFHLQLQNWKNDHSLNQNSGFHTFDIEKHFVSVELACLHSVIFKNYFFINNDLEKLFDFISHLKIHALIIWLRGGKIDAVHPYIAFQTVKLIRCKP